MWLVTSCNELSITIDLIPRDEFINNTLFLLFFYKIEMDINNILSMGADQSANLRVFGVTLPSFNSQSPNLQPTSHPELQLESHLQSELQSTLPVNDANLSSDSNFLDSDSDSEHLKKMDILHTSDDTLPEETHSSIQTINPSNTILTNTGTKELKYIIYTNTHKSNSNHTFTQKIGVTKELFNLDNYWGPTESIETTKLVIDIFPTFMFDEVTNTLCNSKYRTLTINSAVATRIEFVPVEIKLCEDNAITTITLYGTFRTYCENYMRIQAGKIVEVISHFDIPLCNSSPPLPSDYVTTGIINDDSHSRTSHNKSIVVISGTDEIIEYVPSKYIRVLHDTEWLSGWEFHTHLYIPSLPIKPGHFMLEIFRTSKAPRDKQLFNKGYRLANYLDTTCGSICVFLYNAITVCYLIKKFTSEEIIEKCKNKFSIFPVDSIYQDGKSVENESMLLLMETGIDHEVDLAIETKYKLDTNGFS